MRLTGAPHPAHQLLPDADPLETAERLATACAGQTWSWFRTNYFNVLPQLSPVALAALSAELFQRRVNDQARFCLCLSHELRRPEEQRRTPEQLLADMCMAGFRQPSTAAQRRAERAYLHEVEQPPQSWEAEQVARLAHLRLEVQRVLAARERMRETSGNDPVQRDHAPLLLAMDAGDDLDEEAMAEIEELCGMRYLWLAAPDAGAQAASATAIPKAKLH